MKRIVNYHNIHSAVADEEALREAANCLQCANPLCEVSSVGGCPATMLIRERHNLWAAGHRDEAVELQRRRDPIPRVRWTRACPAPCRNTCTAAQGFTAIGIPLVEQAIYERGEERGLFVPLKPARESGKRVAIIGSGPAGLTAAAVLREAGCKVVVYERSDLIGGLFIEIPPMHLEKDGLRHQITALREAGVEFRTNQHVGPGYYNPIEFRSGAWRIWRTGHRDGFDEYDAVIVAVGTKMPRDLGPDFRGGNLGGIHHAMAILEDQARLLMGETRWHPIEIGDKRVVIIGGGLTGLDVRSYALRRGAPQATTLVSAHFPTHIHSSWLKPFNNHQLVLEYDEGGTTPWATNPVAAVSKDNSGHVTHVVTVDPVNGYREIPCDMLVVARGFLGAKHDPEGVVAAMGLDCDEAGHITVDGEFRARVAGTHQNVIAIGDCVTMPSRLNTRLIVDAVGQARDASVFLAHRWGLESYFDPRI